VSGGRCIGIGGGRDGKPTTGKDCDVRRRRLTRGCSMGGRSTSELADIISSIEAKMASDDFDNLSRAMERRARGADGNMLVSMVWLRTTFRRRDRMPGWFSLRDRVSRDFGTNEASRSHVMRGLE
jgi:hypothetical protein